MSDESRDTQNREPRASGPEDDAPALHIPTSSPETVSGEEGFWSAYWERFRRQQVDDPVPEKREGLWDRFRRQDVDDPVRRSR